MSPIPRSTSGRRRSIPHRRGIVALGLLALLSAAVVFASSAFGAAPTVTIGAATPGYVTAAVTGTVDPGGESDTYRFQFATQADFSDAVTGLEGTVEGLGAQAVGGQMTGLAPDTSYHLRLIAINAAEETGEAIAAGTFTTKEVAKPTVTAPTTTVVGGTTATVAGTVEVAETDPAFEASCVFEYATEADFSNAEGTACEPATIVGSESQPVAVTANLSNLLPGRAYHLRLRAANAGGATTVEAGSTFTTEAIAPTVTSTSASEVDSTSAVLRGAFNPGGAGTTYRFDYLTEEQFQNNGEGFAGATSTPTSAPVTTELNASHEAEAVITGLTPETAYRYRMVASNVKSQGGGTAAPVRTLTTPSTSSTGGETTSCPNPSFRTGPSALLPDCRVFEMVTPVDNSNADAYSPAIAELQRNSIFGIGATVPFQASSNGNAVTYAGDPSSPGGNGGAIGGTLANQYLAARSPAGGWSQQNIAPAGHPGTYYHAFSADLGRSVLQKSRFAFGETALLPPSEVPLGSYGPLYTRNSIGDTIGLLSPIPSGMQASEFGFPNFAGGSADFATQVFEARAPLFASAPARPEGTPGSDLYRTGAGNVEAINFLPDGTPEPAAAVGAPSNPIDVEEGAPNYSRAVSIDGSRTVWTGLESHGLYLFEKGHGSTKIDTPDQEPGVGTGGGGVFQTATPDDSEIFFTDDAAAGLTAATKPESGANLYRYDADAKAGHHLIDLTASAEHAEVQAIVGTSEDGTYVYFVANGALTNGAPRGTCGPVYEESTTCGLYVWHEGTLRFITSMTGEDGRAVPPNRISGGAGENGDWAPSLGHRTAQVSHPGTTLLFMSGQQLTSYPNSGLTEVYLYEFTSRQISCISCDPSGAAPREAAQATENHLAALLPTSWIDTRAQMWMSSDGTRVFFDSLLPLVPRDTNGRVDVYEWERDGAGSCRRPAGCVSLISGGESNDNSYLYETTPSGGDVFFTSRSQLASSDKNEAFDVYDARENAEPPQAPAPPCEGEACRSQGAGATPPSRGGSETFSGPVNPEPKRCAKGQTMKRGKCARQKAKKHKKGRRKRSKKRAGHKKWLSK